MTTKPMPLPGRVMWFAESPNGSLASAENEQDAEYMAAMERSAWARQFILFPPSELSAYVEAREMAAFDGAFDCIEGLPKWRQYRIFKQWKESQK